MKTRFAPTPSGYLHQGNALNALLCQRVAREFNLQLGLRIDDYDTSRLRPEFLEDIFNLTNWLELEFTFGPTSPLDQMRNYSLTNRHSELKDFAFNLKHPNLFICVCSRTQLLENRCVAACSSRLIAFETGVTSLRYAVPTDLTDLGDVVIWRRDDIPSYHLANLFMDDEQEITHVVRGEDLMQSSLLHRHLSEQFELKSARKIVYLHHKLLTEHGVKLSKSRGSSAVPREELTKTNLYRLAQTFKLF